MKEKAQLLKYKIYFELIKKTFNIANSIAKHQPYRGTFIKFGAKIITIRPPQMARSSWEASRITKSSSPPPKPTSLTHTLQSEDFETANCISATSLLSAERMGQKQSQQWSQQLSSQSSTAHSTHITCCYCLQVSWKASSVRKSLQVGGRPSCRNFPQRWHGAWNSFM